MMTEPHVESANRYGYDGNINIYLLGGDYKGPTGIRKHDCEELINCD